MDRRTVDQTTNAVGGIVGLPQIAMGIPKLLAGDWLGGGIDVIQGLALLIGFYMIGKGE